MAARSPRDSQGANAAGFLLVADFDADGPVDIVKIEPAGTRGTVYFHKGLKRRFRARCARI
jgi:hypothetical protein